MEYETIGIIVIIIGLISAQIKIVDRKNDREHDKLWKAVVKIAKHLKIDLTQEVIGNSN